jgi:hypothetical protein
MDNLPPWDYRVFRFLHRQVFLAEDELMVILRLLPMRLDIFEKGVLNGELHAIYI